MKKSIAKVSSFKDGLLIKYHANGKTIWSRGQLLHGQPHGYWQWYRLDGTLKRSGYFQEGLPVGTWITYNALGKSYKKTNRGMGNGNQKTK